MTRTPSSARTATLASPTSISRTNQATIRPGDQHDQVARVAAVPESREGLFSSYRISRYSFVHALDGKLQDSPRIPTPGTKIYPGPLIAFAGTWARKPYSGPYGSVAEGPR